MESCSRPSTTAVFCHRQPLHNRHIRRWTTLVDVQNPSLALCHVKVAHFLHCILEIINRRCLSPNALNITPNWKPFCSSFTVFFGLSSSHSFASTWYFILDLHTTLTADICFTVYLSQFITVEENNHTEKLFVLTCGSCIVEWDCLAILSSVFVGNLFSYLESSQLFLSLFRLFCTGSRTSVNSWKYHPSKLLSLESVFLSFIMGLTYCLLFTSVFVFIFVPIRAEVEVVAQISYSHCNQQSHAQLSPFSTAVKIKSPTYINASKPDVINSSLYKP